MAQLMTLTLREAAFVFDNKFKDVVRAVEEHADLMAPVIASGRKVRVLGMRELIYLQALGEVGELLTPKGRFELHEALLASPLKHEVSVGLFSLQLDRLQHQVEERVKALDALKDGVDGEMDDPRIKGTSVEVYRISALLDGGATIDEVGEDYPLLTRNQIEHAQRYAAAIPKAGRPYPKSSFKRAASKLNLDALDEALGEADLIG